MPATSSTARSTARRATSSAIPSPTTPWCSTSACRSIDGISVLDAMAARRAAPCRCSSSPRATAGATRCRASTPAPTTTWRSRSTWRRCWRGCARWCAAPPATPRTRSRCGPLRLDIHAGRVTVDGNPVKLTAHEYRLLDYLMHHTGRSRLADRADRASLRPGLRPRLQHDRGLRRPAAQEARRRPDRRRCAASATGSSAAEGQRNPRAGRADRSGSLAGRSVAVAARAPRRCSGASRSCSSRR